MKIQIWSSAQNWFFLIGSEVSYLFVLKLIFNFWITWRNYQSPPHTYYRSAWIMYLGFHCFLVAFQNQSTWNLASKSSVTKKLLQYFLNSNVALYGCGRHLLTALISTAVRWKYTCDSPRKLTLTHFALFIIPLRSPFNRNFRSTKNEQISKADWISLKSFY